MMQVELASLDYKASRLVRSLDAASGQRGGFGEGGLTEVVSARYARVLRLRQLYTSHASRMSSTSVTPCSSQQDILPQHKAQKPGICVSSHRWQASAGRGGGAAGHRVDSGVEAARVRQSCSCSAGGCARASRSSSASWKM